MITEFKPKTSTEIKRYSLDLFDPAEEDFDLSEGTIAVEILASGDGASPITLTATDVQVRAGVDPDRETMVTFSLHGGTPGVRYLGHVIGSAAVGSPEISLQSEGHFQIEILA